MNYRDRVSASPETLQDFELAAEVRYWDGIELAAAGRGSGAVYLLGYWAEMRLKLSCFRLDAVRPTDAVADRLGPAKKWMKKYCPLVPYEGYHSLA